MMQIIQVSEGQTFLDIAMQYCGDTLRADEIAVLNGLSITQELEAGQELQVPPVAIDKMAIVTGFDERGLIPASRDEDFVGEILDGIDYWYVEDDFIVR